MTELHDRDGHELKGPMDAAGQIWCEQCQVHATPKPNSEEEWAELESREKFSAQLRYHDKKIREALPFPKMLIGQKAKFDDDQGRG